MRIGVLLCTCGGTLNEKIDMKQLENFAKTLDGVTMVKTVDLFCKNPKDVLDEFRGKIDRFIFVGCSERSSLTMGEEKLAELVEGIGVNRAMIETVNAREQCAWLHNDRDGATRKAMDQLLMSYVKVRTNVPQGSVKLAKKALIVGAGVAGMRCASDLAKAGIEAVIVERKPYVGGHTSQIPMLFQCEGYASLCTSDCIVPVMGREIQKDGIRLITNAEVVDVEKDSGNFRVKIEKKAMPVDPAKCISCGKCAEVCPIEVDNPFDFGYGKRKAIDKDFSLAMPDTYTIDMDACNKCGECVSVCPTNAIDLEAKDEVIEETFGAVVIATGFEGYDMEKFEKLNYRHPKVITMLELERLMTKGFKGEVPESVVFVLCQKDEVGYCSKLCCPITAKLAFRLANLYPMTEVTVVYKNLRTYGRAFEEFRRRCEVQGVEFVNAEVEEVREEDGSLVVVTDSEDEDFSEIEADLVVVADPLIPSAVRLMKMFGLQLDKYGFPIEFQPRIITPMETYVDRVYAAGTARSFKDIQESVESGSAAAMKVYEALKDEEKKLQKYVSSANPDMCIGCGMCRDTCPHNAIGVDENLRSKVDPGFCKGCGLCMSVCPTGAIQVMNFEDWQLLRQMEVAFTHAKDGEKRVLALLCYWCSYAAGDLMGRYGIKLPANFRSIRVRCSASVSNYVLLRAITEGYADAILVAGCPPKNCHHLYGNEMEDKRIASLKVVMPELGLDENSVRWEYIGVGMWKKLAEVLKKMSQ